MHFFALRHLGLTSVWGCGRYFSTCGYLLLGLGTGLALLVCGLGIWRYKCHGGMRLVSCMCISGYVLLLMDGGSCDESIPLQTHASGQGVLSLPNVLLQCVLAVHHAKTKLRFCVGIAPSALLCQVSFGITRIACTCG